MDDPASSVEFDRRKHVGFYLRHLSMLPQPYTSADSQKLTLVYFALSALDLLGAVDEKLSNEDRNDYIDWIYQQQCPKEQSGGFRGGPAIGTSVASLAVIDRPGFESATGSTTAPSSRPSSSKQPIATLGGGNLAMTYTALLSLAILRDDFTRLDRPAILYHLSTCQQADGSFAPSIGHREYDCRFLFCAFAVCWILDDWSAIDVEKAIGFLRRSRSWDGSFGQAEMQEGHGGSTYCAVSALALAGKLDVLDEPALRHRTRSLSAERLGGGRREDLERWLLSRQQSGTGFNGRIEKPVDTCYSFWCGAALQILGHHDAIDAESDIRWLLSAVSPIGGISKVPDDPPDLMHSYLSMAALAMHAHEGSDHADGTSPAEVSVDEGGSGGSEGIQQLLRSSLQRLDAALNLSETSKAWLVEHLHARQP